MTKVNNYKNLTHTWLCHKFADFHDVNLEWPDSLFCGKPQAGKSVFTFAVSLMHLLQNKPCIFVVRNHINDAVHMQAKIERFTRNHMRRLGFCNCPSIGTVYAGDMSFVKVGKDTEGNDIHEIRGQEQVRKALKGGNMKMIIVLTRKSIHVQINVWNQGNITLCNISF